MSEATRAADYGLLLQSMAGERISTLKYQRGICEHIIPELQANERGYGDVTIDGSMPSLRKEWTSWTRLKRAARTNPGT